MTPIVPAAQPLALHDLVVPTEDGIASRVLVKADGGSVTLFAFDAGTGLTEHTSLFEALVVVLEGVVVLTIAGAPVRATPGIVVRLPGGVPHAVDAAEHAGMLLIMVRDWGDAPRSPSQA